MSNARILSLDAGTTSVRCLAVTGDGHISAVAQQEFAQHYPRPGWVEHDPGEIWEAARATVLEVLDSDAVDASAIAGIGVTNQRETVVAWRRSTGVPVAPAIVWQDRRTAERCRELRDIGLEAPLREATGLVCDPYFSATKMEWLLGHLDHVPDDLVFGTIDSWLAFKLTGGTHVTDASNASRTLLYDLRTDTWSPELLDLFGISSTMLPEVVDSSGPVGTTDPDALGGHEIPLAGMAGDQQSALFGQACFAPGMTKNTYGTGSFVLQNAGTVPPPTSAEMLATVAWRLDGVTTYALEGSIFITGAAIKWLRDRLGLISESAEMGPLASSVPDAGGVVVVPAMAGLGAPWWEPGARGAVFGLSSGLSRAHLARAVVESMAFQTRDVVEAQNTVLGRPCTELRVDGGAAVMDVLCQLVTDQLGIDVVRPAETETTALGAAFLAGLATGVWGSLDQVADAWSEERRFTPPADRSTADAAHEAWRRGVDRVLQEAGG